MKEKTIKIIEISMFICLSLFMIFAQGNHVLWLDELDWSIGIVDNGNLIEVYNRVLGTGENLPLFYILLFFLRSVFKITNIWVLTLLTATIFTIFGIIGIYKIINSFFDKKNSIVSSFLIFTSYPIISMCAWQFRPYGMLLCFSVWTLYFYLKRIKEENWKNIILYAVFMILLMNSHWYGVLMSVIYAFIDLILFLKKKISIKCIVSYLAALIIFLPSFIKLLLLHRGDIGTYGVEYLNLGMLIIVLAFVSGEQLSYLLVFLLAVLLAFIRIIRKKENLYFNIIYISSILLIIVTCVYSILNKNGGIVRGRYFAVIIPHAIIIMSWFIKGIIEKTHKNPYVWPTILVFTILFAIYGVCKCYYFSVIKPNYYDPGYYQSASEYLQKQEDIYDDDTVIICSYGKTWVYQYWIEENKKLPSNIIVVDPLKYPNQMDMAEQSIDKFEYVVKDGKLVDGKKVNDFDKYNTIYYLEQYRRIEDRWKENIQIKFDLIYENKDIGLEKYCEK